MTRARNITERVYDFNTYNRLVSAFSILNYDSLYKTFFIYGSVLYEITADENLIFKDKIKVKLFPEQVDVVSEILTRFENDTDFYSLCSNYEKDFALLKLENNKEWWKKNLKRVLFSRAISGLNYLMNEYENSIYKKNK